MLEVIDSSLRFPTGQGGLKTVRLEMTLTSPIQAQADTQIDFRDDNGPGELGWREIIVVAEDGVDLISSTAATEDRSQALTNYPVDLLQDPPAQRTATVVYRPGASDSPGFATFTSAIASASAPSEDPFADLIAVPVSGPMALLLTLLAAFVWGAAHAMSPGHGKTIVAAYLVGSRGTAKHALFLGLTTTVTHTAGVFALGGITLFASQFILPEQLLPWLSILSGLLVVGIGISMFWGRLRPLVLRQAHHHFHEHAIGHHHTHDHGHHHYHPHEHDHAHAHGDHHDHAHTHSHLPPGANGQPVTWRSLLALGISGGLLPCPSALVVMLGAIALGRIGFGLLLILVFSLGLASVLTLVGILMVHAGKLVKHVPEGGRLLRLAPIGSALFITIAGVVITVQAILQIGTLSL
ncbi:high-affinity nickel-transporter [bacterium]|nr:high-affinity nickel-transporter [bacterium]